MAHVVMIQVTIDPASDIEHRHSILKEYVIPEAKKQPGFQKGIWLNDGAGVGTCVVQFDTRENAAGALGVLAPSNGPEIISTAICAVEIET